MQGRAESEEADGNACSFLGVMGEREIPTAFIHSATVRRAQQGVARRGSGSGSSATALPCHGRADRIRLRRLAERHRLRELRGRVHIAGIAGALARANAVVDAAVAALFLLLVADGKGADFAANGLRRALLDALLRDGGAAAAKYQEGCGAFREGSRKGHGHGLGGRGNGGWPVALRISLCERGQHGPGHCGSASLAREPY